MHDLILWFRSLRKVPVFKVSVRALFIILIVLGSWVATRKLNIPPSLALNDKVIHLVVFFGFALLIDLATSRRPFWLWKALPLVLYGLSIEIMQYFSPDRTFSLLDWVADCLGILLYFMLKITMLWLDSKK